MKTIAAATAAPAMPGQVFAGNTGISAAIYDRAVHYTRLWGTSVPEMYTSALGLDLDQANALFGRLVTDKVIASPNANGFAQAVAPYLKAPALVQTTAETAGRSVKPKLNKALKLGDDIHLDDEDKITADSDLADEQPEVDADPNGIEEV